MIRADLVPSRRWSAVLALWLPVAGFVSIGGVADVARGRLPLAAAIEKALFPAEDADRRAPHSRSEGDDSGFTRGETESNEAESGETESGGDHLDCVDAATAPGLAQESFVDPHKAFLPDPPFIPTVIPPDGLRA